MKNALRQPKYLRRNFRDGERKEPPKLSEKSYEWPINEFDHTFNF